VLIEKAGPGAGVKENKVSLKASAARQSQCDCALEKFCEAERVALQGHRLLAVL
jgi:hypothetical protein